MMLLFPYKKIDKFYYEKYDDFVYSLKINKYELYVSDGILTHNSIYGFNAADEKIFNWLNYFQIQKHYKIIYFIQGVQKM